MAQDLFHLFLSLVQDHPYDPKNPEIPQDPHHPQSILKWLRICFVFFYLSFKIILRVLKIPKYLRILIILNPP